MTSFRGGHKFPTVGHPLITVLLFILLLFAVAGERELQGEERGFVLDVLLPLCPAAAFSRWLSGVGHHSSCCPGYRH
jgi:hypothetical protein